MKSENLFKTNPGEGEVLLNAHCSDEFDWDDLEIVEFLSPRVLMPYPILCRSFDGVLGQDVGEEVWRNRKSIPYDWTKWGTRILFGTIWGNFKYCDVTTRRIFCLEYFNIWRCCFIDLDEREGLFGGCFASCTGFKVLRLKSG